MGQYADQPFLDSDHHAVDDVMEVLLDVAPAVLGTLGKGYKPGEALGRLDASEEVGIVTVLRSGASATRRCYC